MDQTIKPSVAGIKSRKPEPDSRDENPGFRYYDRSSGTMRFTSDDLPWGSGGGAWPAGLGPGATMPDRRVTAEPRRSSSAAAAPAAGKRTAGPDEKVARAFEAGARSLGRSDGNLEEQRGASRPLDPPADRDGSGDEFLQSAQGRMSSRRLAIVDQAFRSLDIDGSGALELGEFLVRYDCKHHPDVKRGTADAVEVLKRFIVNFEVGGVKDGVVTKQEFQNYYNGVSAGIDNDDYFEHMVRAAWGLEGDAPGGRIMRLGQKAGRPQSANFPAAGPSRSAVRWLRP